MASNHIEKVAIVGATGNIGKHIVAGLREAGKHKLTALTRADSKTDIDASLNPVNVDYADEASLVSALTGQDALIIALSASAEIETEYKLAAAAVKAGVRLIMPNTWGADMDNRAQLSKWLVGRRYLDTVERIESLIAAAGGKTAWASIGGSFWYVWSVGYGPNTYGFDIPGRKATLYDGGAGAGATRITTTTEDMVGRAVAALLGLPVARAGADAAAPAVVDDWRNSSVHVRSFRVTQRDMLDSLHRALRTTDADWQLDSEPADARLARGMELLRAGDPSGFVIALYALTFTRDWVWRDDSDNARLGLPEEDDLDAATRRGVEFALARAGQ